MVHTIHVRYLSLVLILVSITFLHAQIEDIPASQESIDETLRGAPEEAPSAEKAVDAYSGATEMVVDPVAVLYEALTTQGHVVIEDIIFNNDNTLAIESDSGLETISQMLKTHPRMNIYIVGHTDNTTGVLAGMIMSQKRAEAVMNTLSSRFGIDLDRLFASGVGPLSPITSNDTEEGRAQNNRIELVVQ